MTMEVILSTAFGRSVDVQGGKGGEVYEAARGLFASIGESSGKYLRYVQFIICKDIMIKYTVWWETLARFLIWRIGDFTENCQI